MADFKGTREAFAQAIIDMAETEDVYKRQGNTV